MELLIGDRVDVYRNLRNGMFSIRKKGKVISYSNYVTIQNPKFVVSQAGRQRVLDKKQKNVHAVVRGNYVGNGKLDNTPYNQGHYDPYKFAQFVNKETSEEINEASLAYLEEGKVYYI